MVFEPFEHYFAALQIGVAFVVYLVKADAQIFVGLVKAGVNPGVHLFPQRAYFGIALFPFDEHLVSLYNERCLTLSALAGRFGIHAFGFEFLSEFSHLFAIVFVKAT